MNMRYYQQLGINFPVEYAFHQTIGIYFKTKSWADALADQIIKYYEYNDAIKRIIRNHTEIAIWLKCDKVIRFVPAWESSKGCRFDRIFVQEGIDRDIINTMIDPSLNPQRIQEINNHYDNICYAIY